MPRANPTSATKKPKTAAGTVAMYAMQTHNKMKLKTDPVMRRANFVIADHPSR